MIEASIVVTTYNHEDYIEKCLTSILNQTTKHKVEIIWHDDASTDNTISIGEDILKKCNHEITRIHRPNNRYQRKIPTLLDIIERSRGKYIFWAEGDDFWLSNKKIDYQIEAMNIHPNINICFTPAYIINGNDPIPNGILAQHSKDVKIFSLTEVICGDGGFMPTISLCFRRDIFNNCPTWLYEHLPVLDYPMQVIASAPNGAIYLPEITSAYRQNIAGSWSTTVYNDAVKRLSFEADFIQLISKLYQSFPDNRDAFIKIINSHFYSLQQLSFALKKYSELQRGTHILNNFF
jgi:glycosyltransferase involved in cell wall biosynthesis